MRFIFFQINVISIVNRFIIELFLKEENHIFIQYKSVKTSRFPYLKKRMFFKWKTYKYIPNHIL